MSSSCQVAQHLDKALYTNGFHLELKLQRLGSCSLGLRGEQQLLLTDELLFSPCAWLLSSGYLFYSRWTRSPATKGEGLLRSAGMGHELYMLIVFGCLIPKQGIQVFGILLQHHLLSGLKQVCHVSPRVAMQIRPIA